MPFGIANLIYSGQAKTKLLVGDYDGAIKASAKADQWGNWGIAAGFIWYIIMFIIMRSK